MRRQTMFTCVVVGLLAATGRASSDDFLKTYGGTPFRDARHPGAQAVPGRVECAAYDRGGEGVAFHDADPKNHGSGELNPADGTYLNQFRMSEGVDISYTKLGRTPDVIDDNAFQPVVPPGDQLYVGWTEPGEWFNVTVDVAREGDYVGSLLYTSNRGGSIALDVNGRPAAGDVRIESTYDAKDPVAWRQWHHWRVADRLVRVHLPAGKVVLTVHVTGQGQMNFAYFDFAPAE